MATKQQYINSFRVYNPSGGGSMSGTLSFFGVIP